MGARGVQQLRLTAIEPQLAPVRSSVHIPVATLWAHFQGGDVDAGLTELRELRPSSAFSYQFQILVNELSTPFIQLS
jgi:hypothetical protein